MSDQTPQKFPPGSGQERSASSPPPPPPPPPPWTETEGRGPGWQQAPPPGDGGWGQPASPGYGYGYGYPRPSDAFGRPLAEWWRRAVAIIIDGIIIAIPIYVIFVLIIGVGAANGNCTNVNGQVTCTNTAAVSGSAWGSIIVGIIAPLVYFALLDGSDKGQTLGKMAMHIATRDASTGGSIGYGRALVRRFIYEILWYLFFIPGLLNVLSPLWDTKRQAWHDKAVNSVVIEVP